MPRNPRAFQLKIDQNKVRSLNQRYNVAPSPCPPIADTLVLQGLAFGGAALYILNRGCKFSLFKPAEEMVYITLDSESRTKGKAAIDVVGAQTGKSASSVLQQLLLLVSAGNMTIVLPVMMAFQVGILRSWLHAVFVLSKFHEQTTRRQKRAEDRAKKGEEGPFVDSQPSLELDIEVPGLPNRTGIQAKKDPQTDASNTSSNSEPSKA